MRKYVKQISILTFTAMLAACSQTGQTIGDNQIPAGVNAAFTAEHPYAKMDHPTEKQHQNGPAAYVIPYTRPDGTRGEASYSPAGVLLEDK